MTEQTKKRSFIPIFTRDIIVSILLIYLWYFTNQWAVANNQTFAIAISIAVGGFSGFMLNRLMHEWGHYFGAKMFGAACHLHPITKFGIIFDYDMENNNDIQFKGLGVGGTLAHWSIAFALLFLIDKGSMGAAAIKASAFGYVVSATIIEFPPIIRSFMGEPSQKAYDFNRKFIINWNKEKTVKTGGILGILSMPALFMLFM